MVLADITVFVSLIGEQVHNTYYMDTDSAQLYINSNECKIETVDIDSRVIPQLDVLAKFIAWSEKTSKTFARYGFPYLRSTVCPLR